MKDKIPKILAVLLKLKKKGYRESTIEGIDKSLVQIRARITRLCIEKNIIDPTGFFMTMSLSDTVMLLIFFLVAIAILFIGYRILMRSSS